MYIYTTIYIYIYIYIYTHKILLIYKHTHIHKTIHSYTHIQTTVYAYTHIHIHNYIYIYIYTSSSSHNASIDFLDYISTHPHHPFLLVGPLICILCLQILAILSEDGSFLIKTHVLCFVCVHVETNVSSCLLQALQQGFALGRYVCKKCSFICIHYSFCGILSASGLF